MKIWRVQEIADLGYCSLSTVKKAIYVKKRLPVFYPAGVHTPLVKHTDLVAWLGFDPLDDSGANIEITKIVKTKDKTVTIKTRIERDSQAKLFDF